jgi:hypothetical protein
MMLSARPAVAGALLATTLWVATPEGPGAGASTPWSSRAAAPEAPLAPIAARAAAPQSARPAARGAFPTCAPGPQRVSDMDLTADGYLKVRPREDAEYTEFTFARAIYSEDGRGGFGFRRGGDFLGDGGPAWSIDYPSADRHMMIVARRLSRLEACEWGYPISLADPDLRRFPFVYSLEWGYARLTEVEVSGLRDYLRAGGFLMIDDFWGSVEWAILERELARVLPDRQIVDIPRDHVFFRIYYRIEGEIVQVPGAGNGRAISMGVPGARTWERDGYTPHIRGIFDDDGRLIVAINFNTDLGDALEWAEDPFYPLEYSKFASEVFLNTIIYALSY